MSKTLPLLIGILVLGSIAMYGLKRGPVLLLRPPSEERIAFVSTRDGTRDLYTMKTDGSDVKRLTQDSADDMHPVWSPDAREIASLSDRHKMVYQIFLSAWDGRYTDPFTISEGTKDMPVWSHDGREITFISGGKVYRKRRDGGREIQFLPPAGRPEMIAWVTYLYAEWTPNQEHFFYVRNTDLGREVFSANKADVGIWEDEGIRSIGITAAQYLNVAVKPSTNESIIAVSFIDRNGKNGILIADLDAQVVEDLYVFDDDAIGPGKLAWSPDGTKIAFEQWSVSYSMPNRAQGIYILEIGSDQPSVVMEGQASQPTWSSDSKKIACTVMDSNNSGRRDIWRVNIDGSEKINLTNGQGDNYYPAWSPAVK